LITVLKLSMQSKSSVPNLLLTSMKYSPASIRARTNNLKRTTKELSRVSRTSVLTLLPTLKVIFLKSSNKSERTLRSLKLREAETL
jgi:hypothetical protein